MGEWFAEILEFCLDFANVLNASVAAGWMILAVLLLRIPLKKAPKWISVALWGLVALRLLLPFSIESAFSLIPSPRTVAHELVQGEGLQLQQRAYLDLVTNPVFPETVSVELEQTTDGMQIGLMAMTPVWLLGTALMALYTLVSWSLLYRRVSGAVRLRENIYECGGIDSPFVLGMLRPRIYLPFHMDEQTMVHVIAHEQTHIRRKDHWWKPLGFFLLSIHWFNPLMWLAYILLCRDIELACDEKVIRELGRQQRADYSQALLSCSANRRLISACPVAFGEVSVRQRVKNVLRYRRPAFWIILAAVLVCVLVALCFLTNPLDEGTPADVFAALEPADISRVQMTVWEEDPVHKDLTQSQTGELLSILKGIRKYDYQKQNWSDHALSVAILCGEKIILLQYADDRVGFLFDTETALLAQSDVWSVKNDTLNAFMERLLGNSAPAPLMPGTVLVSERYLYMNPLSSYYPFGGDSGFRYHIGADYFAAEYRQTGETGTIDVPEWEWQEFPYTDAQWADMYWIDSFAVQYISREYDSIWYQPLNEEMFLLLADGELWAVNLWQNSDRKPYIWSIFTLVPEDAAGLAFWEYQPASSVYNPGVTFVFDEDCTRVTAHTVEGSLSVFEEFPNAMPDAKDLVEVPPQGYLCWRPTDGNGGSVTDSRIMLTIYQDDLLVANGVICIRSEESTGPGNRLYTATVIGAGLRIHQSAGQSEAIISVVQ